MPLRCAFLLLQLATLLAFNTATATASGTATTASPKLRLFTAFSPTPTTDGSAPAPNATGVVNSSMALAMLDAAPVKQFASDFILIGEFLHAPAQMQVEGYDATNNAQILYQRSRWRLIQEGSDYETVPLMWARFEAVDDANATTCLGVAQWNASWNTDNAGETSDQHPASLLASVDASCKPSDVVALALTSPAGNATLAHLEAAGASNTAASKRMVEAARLLHQQQYVSSGVAILDIPSSASSRLFLRMHDSMCADRAATLSGLKGGAVAWSALALELCNGTGCSICKPAAFTAASDENESRTSSDSGSKHTLVILLSCGLFLAASVPVVLVLFRHQFFSPAANTKEENELTTNLAYVLRI